MEIMFDWCRPLSLCRRPVAALTADIYKVSSRLPMNEPYLSDFCLESPRDSALQLEFKTNLFFFKKKKKEFLRCHACLLSCAGSIWLNKSEYGCRCLGVNRVRLNKKKKKHVGTHSWRYSSYTCRRTLAKTFWDQLESAALFFPRSYPSLPASHV